MPFIGNKPSAVPLTSADITDNIIVNADINTNAGITTEKLSLISTASVASVTAKGTPSVSDGYIQLNCEQNSHGIKIKSPPHSAGANYTMVMPNSLGTASQVLRMNSGATALEFGTLASGIIQIKQTVKTDTFSSASSSFTDITGLSVSITPTLSTSKILVIVDAKVGGVNTGTPTRYRLLRDSTAVYIGDANGSRSRTYGMFSVNDGAGYAIAQMGATFIDNPATTSALTYKIQMATDTSTSYLNRGDIWNDNIYYATMASSITVIELAVGIL